MEVRYVDEGGSSRHDPADLPELLAREGGVVWVDVPPGDEECEWVLREVFGFHPLAVKDALERNRVPKAHGYADHVFFVVHKPQRGEHGHVHYVELDQFVGRRFLVTVHGPLNAKVDDSVALEETRAVAAKLDDGRLRPRTAFELSHSVISALVRRHEDFLEAVTADVWRLEQQVTSGRLVDPEAFIAELFQARHGLLAVRTMAALAGTICESMAALPRISADGGAWVVDMARDFIRVRNVADGEREYLQGVIDYYRTLLALRSADATQAQTDAGFRQNEDIKKISGWAAILFAPTLVGTVYGMNFDHMPELHWVAGYPLALVLMVATSLALHRIFHRRGWL